MMLFGYSHISFHFQLSIKPFLPFVGELVGQCGNNPWAPKKKWKKIRRLQNYSSSPIIAIPLQSFTKSREVFCPISLCGFQSHYKNFGLQIKAYFGQDCVSNQAAINNTILNHKITHYMKSKKYKVGSRLSK